MGDLGERECHLFPKPWRTGQEAERGEKASCSLGMGTRPCQAKALLAKEVSNQDLSGKGKETSEKEGDPSRSLQALAELTGLVHLSSTSRLGNINQMTFCIYWNEEKDALSRALVY